MFNRESLENPIVILGLAVLALAVLTVGSSSGRLITTLMHNAELSEDPTSRTAGPSKVNPALITDRNFFGLASDKPLVDLEKLPETQLELTLRGAFAAAEGQPATAIIEENKRKVSEAYKVGDPLPGDAKLSAVYPDRIVLSRNGLLETLYFPQDFSTAGVGSRLNIDATPTSTLPATTDKEATKRREAIRDRIRQLRGKK